MSDNYEAWISAELAFRKRAALNYREMVKE